MEKVKIKRIYEKADKSDGLRILVDRLWPRGIKKEGARIDYWLKNIAPSGNLRKWFGHKPERWEGFKKRYRQELNDDKMEMDKLKKLTKNKTATLLYAAKDSQKNNAAVLLEFLKQQ